MIKQIMRGRIVNGGTIWVSDGQNTNDRPKLQLKSAPAYYRVIRSAVRYKIIKRLYSPSKRPIPCKNSQ